LTNTSINQSSSPTRSPDDKEQSRQSAHWALAAALDKLALEPVLLHVGGLCSYTEYLLIVSGRSERQVDAISEAVRLELKKRGRTAIGVEGTQSGQWALLDFGDVVIHVFHHPLREHYDLESLWIDAERVEIDIPDTARLRVDEQY